MLLCKDLSATQGPLEALNLSMIDGAKDLEILPTILITTIDLSRQAENKDILDRQIIVFLINLH